jgi:hypothetical protein
MDPQANPSNSFSPKHCGWTSSQLQHVQTELAKEYSNVSRTLIENAIADAQQGLDPRQGTVRLLMRARKHLASDVLNMKSDNSSFGQGWQMSA